MIMKKMNPVVHFEMQAEDRTRMADFYTKVFGWKAQMLGPEMGDYVLVTTSDVDENGRPKDAGMIKWRFLSERGRFSSTSIGGHSGWGYQRIHEGCRECGRQGAWRTSRDSRRWFVRVVYRY